MVWLERGALAGIIILALVPLALLIMTALNIPPASKWFSHTVVKTEVINNTIIKYVNRTIVKTVYINQTVPVPVYVNRTIYVPVPSNTTLPFNMGTCHIYSLVFNNGTVWTLGYWIPTPQAWGEIYNTTLIYWGRMNGTAGYQVTTEFAALFIAYPMEGYTGQLNLLANIPNSPPPGWVNMIYMGDWVGIGPLTVNSARIQGNTLVIPSTTTSVPPLAIPFNTTVTVIIVPYPGFVVVPILIPCNWTVIKTPLTPEQALSLPAPMGSVINYELGYVTTGLTNYTSPVSWGWMVWNYNAKPVNVTNLPWPVR